ncbi:MAG: RdgB/HAM1 family non-canonical purine NTP pyrophosphatase [Defluviitaleaceae bacterium]|nr:RdgB/HAM1 family non-canonical purine NTP pyrophosphatase [Defluviitaleaceae bacterium]
MTDIVFATSNENKLKEIRKIMSDSRYNIITMKQLGIANQIEEDGNTFCENAVKKASGIMKITEKPTLADDSGIEIDFLDKKPGVHSAMFLGIDTPYSIRNLEILKMLKDVPFEKRTARFVCVIACALTNGDIITAEGVFEGHIAYDPKGENGFGYDPIFYVKEYGMTSAEMDINLKNCISHRGKALRDMAKKLEEIANKGYLK